MGRRFFKALVIFLAACAFCFQANAETLGTCKTKTGTGFLEKTSQGDLVLHLEGSYYDMGFQHATLFSDQTQIAVRAGRNSIRHQYPYLPFSWVIAFLNTFVYEKAAPYIPQEYKDEMQGLADVSGVSLKLIHAAHASTYMTSCASASAWGPATKDGRLYFIRSNDSFVNIDPETNKSWQDLGMVIIYEPLNEVPYMMIAWPGYIGASDGMNAQGIAISNMSDPSRYETPAGVPMSFRLKQALAKSHNLEEAIKWMSVKPFEGGYNFMVVDGKIPDGRVIEMDAETLYVGGWDGPAESNRYTYQGKEYIYEPKKDLLTRTNHPLSPQLIANHKDKIDGDKNYITANRYKDLRGRLVKDYGALDLESMYGIIRGHYQAMTYGDKPTLGATTHQFAMEPKTGDFLIAFCKGNPLEIGRSKASAFNQPYHKYNFFDLLNEKP